MSISLSKLFINTPAESATLRSEFSTDLTASCVLSTAAPASMPKEENSELLSSLPSSLISPAVSEKPETVFSRLFILVLAASI